MNRGRLELPLLLAAVAAPLAPGWLGGALLLAIAAGWIWTRPPRREIVVVGAAFLLAAFFAGGRGGVPADEAEQAIGGGYARLWSDLDRSAAAATTALPPPAEIADDPLAAFRRLADLGPRWGEAATSLMVLDADGNAVVWAGPGLLHDPRPGDLPAEGAAVKAGFGALTLFSVRRLDEERRPWRVVAARSFAGDRLPFTLEGELRPRPGPWSAVADPPATVPGARLVPLEGKPALAVAPEALTARQERLPREAWALVGLALVGLALMRGVGWALAQVAPAVRPAAAGEVAALGIAGLVAWGLAAETPAWTLAALVAGGLLAVLARRRPGKPRRPVPAAAGGVLATVALAAFSWAVQRRTGAIDLGSSLIGEWSTACLPLALAAAALGLLGLSAGGERRGGAVGPVSRRSGGGGEADRDVFAWASLALILAAAAAHDLPLLALPLLAAGGGGMAAWLAGRGGVRGASVLAVTGLAAALLSGGAWEIAYRSRLRAELEHEIASRLSLPDGATLAAWRRDAEAALAGRDLERLVPRAAEELELQDLAFVLWRGSPLARRNALSALVVEPAEGRASTFSFGLPLDDGGQVAVPPGWAEEAVGWPSDAAGGPPLATGEAEVTAGGRAWGRLRWWLVPRPGFSLPGAEALREIEVGLLRGGPAGGLRPEGLPEPALFALYGAAGQALVSPWPETPPLPEPLAGASPGAGVRRARVSTPDGPAWGFSSGGAVARSVVYLPLLDPLAGLERVATHAAGTVLFAALLALLALVLALPRSSFRGLLRDAVRSYPKRLLVVYTVLLLVPLLLLNLVLLAAVEERLRREQRAAGEAALESAQRQVADLLELLPPGFGIDTSLDDDRLSRISRVVRHEVNLYWRSAIYASSKAELFAAGLLPRRIPGDVHARLAYRGFELASRTNRVGRASYLELYSPLRVPGAPASPEQLVLSVPLLAQQEEVARELGSLRRQAFLVTAALLALLTAVGARLARNFTRPLMEVVRGTARIAGGATSLDLAPRDRELAALVAAVDAMAGRIAEGRDRLVREKQVVERMVDNITSGVVSLDGGGRVLMHNRVAAELLGVEVGAQLAAALEDAPKLEAVSEFVAEHARQAPAQASGGTGGGSPPAAAQRTVRLAGDDGEEREWSLVWVPVPGSGEPAALLVVEDATETLRGQRLQAWAEMARIIAHEIKNPLTPLQLNLEHLRQVWRDRFAGADDGGEGDRRFAEVLDRCTANALTQVEELRQIASEFSTYSSIPRIDPRLGDLAAAMRELAEAYRAAPPPGVTVEFTAEPDELPARFDKKLLGRAVRNLVENALRASAGGGTVRLTVERVEAGGAGEVPEDGSGGDSGGGAAARIAVADSGPGVGPELLGRIFHPYFSTHDSGTGLGLPIARQVAEEHGGAIHARNRPGGGLEVAITIPLP